jgi:hypothetical protein
MHICIIKTVSRVLYNVFLKDVMDIIINIYSNIIQIKVCFNSLNSRRKYKNKLNINIMAFVKTILLILKYILLKNNITKIINVDTILIFL